MGGYTAEEFLTKGPHFTLSLLHPEDRIEIIHQVHPKQIQFLLSLPAGEYKNYKFTYNSRFRRADGNYVPLYKQEVVLQTDQVGFPTLMMGIASDISNQKSDSIITLSAHKSKSDNSPIQTIKLYSSQEDILSDREKEVLQQVINGKTTKQIAEVLCISPYTVKNHRKHMLEKTNTKNVADLVRFAYAKGLV